MGGSSTKVETVSHEVASSIHTIIMTTLRQQVNNTISQALIDINHAKHVRLHDVDVKSELANLHDATNQLLTNESFINQLADKAIENLKDKRSGLAGVISQNESQYRQELSTVLKNKECIKNINIGINNTMTRAIVRIYEAEDVRLDHVNVTIQMKVAINNIETELRTIAHSQNLRALSNLFDAHEESGLGDTVANISQSFFNTIKSIGIVWVLVIGAVIISAIWFFPMIFSAITGGTFIASARYYPGIISNEF